MAATQELIYEKEEGVAVITLNRPHRLNSITHELGHRLYNLLAEIERDEEVRAVILTGARRPDGRPCFCTGHDLKELKEHGAVLTLAGQKRTALMAAESIYKGAGLEQMTPIAGACERIDSLGKPVIAAIDGPCTAGGLELALSCDIRLVSETAEISDMHIKNIGAIGGGGAPPRLARIVGASWAKEMAFIGDVLNGNQACQIGFANHVYPPDRLMAEAKALAKKIAGMRPEAVRLTKANINAAFDMDFSTALRYNYLLSCLLGGRETQWVEKKESKR